MKRILSVIVFGVLLFQHISLSQTLSKSQKLEITESLISLLKENYVLQDSVKYIVPALKNSYHSDEFKSTQSSEEFSRYLTILLREITKDAHFGFLYNPRLSALLGGPGVENSEELSNHLTSIGGGTATSASELNYHFRKVEVLDGNVGYMKLEQIPSLDEAKETLDAAMVFLSNSNAFILDLRGNQGGVGGFIPYLMSYFFPKKKMLLYKREMPAPAWDSISYHYTHRDLPGKRLTEVPTFILTDEITGSAATNLAYTMQSFGRATIVGENTGSGYRGAHSASLFSLPHGLVGLIPIGRVVNARTNTNWRTDGVIPDIETSSARALDEAYKLALEALIQKEKDAGKKQVLVSIYEEQNKPPNGSGSAQSTIEFQKYTGSYEGGRKIWTEDEKLMYIREGGSPLILKFQKQHLYKITLPSNARTTQPLPSVKFNLDKDGEVDNITLVFDNGMNTLGPFKKL